MPRDTGPFRVNQRVLVAYTDKYYEAKVHRVTFLVYKEVIDAHRWDAQRGSVKARHALQVTKAEKRPDGWYYMLHYTVRSCPGPCKAQQVTDEQG